MPIADALTRRTDTSWVTIISGGTEVLCVTQTRNPHERNDLLLDKLTRTSRVVGVGAHCVLHTFLSRPTPWSGLLTALNPAQAGALRLTADQPPPVPGTVFGSQPGDEALLQFLARDGRAAYGEPAAASGWSQSTVKRRLGYLRATGSLYFDLDYDAALFGVEMTARLWMSVTPSKLAAVGTALAAHPEAAFVGATAANLAATVLCADADGLYRYLTLRIGDSQQPGTSRPHRSSAPSSAPAPSSPHTRDLKAPAAAGQAYSAHRQHNRRRPIGRDRPGPQGGG